MTDAGLEHLKGLTRLQSLNLAETKVTDAGLEHLKGLTHLQSLDLMSNQGDRRWAETSQRIDQTPIAKPGTTKVTDAGVKGLQKALPNCKIDH